jgi:hypothetical protein
MVFVYQDFTKHIHSQGMVREGRMKSHKARRLSLRVPVIGWEAYVSSNSSENTRAKIANISADGAYLITREQYHPASTVALSIKSPIISFSVTGMVVRNDPYGVAIRFLDHSNSTRNSLLKIISKLLAGKRSNLSDAKEAPIRNKSQAKLNVDARQESFQASGLLSTPSGNAAPRLRVRKSNRSSEAECFYTTALMATEPCSEDSHLTESTRPRSKENSFVICSSRTRSNESLKVFLSHCGTTTVKCPLCEKRHYTRVPERFHNKSVRAKCECGESFPVLFDSRKYFRKEVRLLGEYWGASGMQGLMTIKTLSICGAGFETRRGNISLNEGETIQIKFLLDNSDRKWITLKAVVKRVKGNQVGVEFTELNDHERKCIGFYLMP